MMLFQYYVGRTTGKFFPLVKCSMAWCCKGFSLQVLITALEAKYLQTDYTQTYSKCKTWVKYARTFEGT